MKSIDMHRQLAKRKKLLKIGNKKKKNPAKLAVVTDLWPNDSGWLGKTLLAAPKCTFHIITK